MKACARLCRKRARLHVSGDIFTVKAMAENYVAAIVSFGVRGAN